MTGGWQKLFGCKGTNKKVQKVQGCQYGLCPGDPVSQAFRTGGTADAKTALSWWLGERRGDWKAFPEVACASVLKQMLSKRFFVFIQSPLTAVGFICWAGCIPSCGLLDRDTGSCLAHPQVPLLPGVGSLQGPGPLAQGVVLLQGSAVHLLPGHSLCPAGGQAGHGLHVAGTAPTVSRVQLRGCLQGGHSCHSISLRDAGKAEGAGCISGVCLPTAAAWEGLLWQELSSWLSSAHKTMSCQEGCLEISCQYKWKSKGRPRKRWGEESQKPHK